MKTQTYVCETFPQVQSATDNLCKAHEVTIHIDDGGVMKEVKNFKGIYNSTQGKFCAAVVPYYHLIGHKHYFDSFAEAMGRLGLSYTMTIKESGNRAFADIEFKGRNLKFDKLNEEFTTGIRLINSYDKSTGLHVIPRFTRLACTNGMIITRDERTFSVKHHTKMLIEIESFIERKINDIINNDAQLQMWVSTSIKDTVEWIVAVRVLEKLFAQPKHREEILKRLGIDMITNTDKKTKKVTFSYIWKDTTKQKAKLDRWTVYNAITHYLTHGEQITPHIENIFHKQAEKLLTTPFEKMPMAEVVI
jgi:hypothetical protein